MSDTPHLDLDAVSKIYTLSGGLMKPAGSLTAVDSVSLSVARGETLGLVGESGCGKSSLARLILRLEEPSAGTIRIDGEDIAHLRGSALKAARRRVQMIFQDPYASLNPRMRVRRIIAEALVNYRVADRDGIAARVEDIAAQAGLSPFHLDRFPHELSGGQCQRVGIARAIALEPELIVADEPVSALDVSIQAQILNLIMKLQETRGLTLVFISHDLSVVSHIADRVAVMYLGRIAETGPAQRIFARPAHPYTRTLLAAVPRPVPEARGKRAAITGELPSPLDPPSGCRFRTRCPFAEPRCAAESPPLRDIGAGQQVACHFAEAIGATTPAPTESPAHA